MENKKLLKILWVISFGIFYFPNIVFAQSLGLNNATPDASSILDLTATDRGLLAPRMTQAQRNLIASPATSLLIYQTDNTPGFYYNAGTPGVPNWVPFLSTNPSTATGTGGWSLTGNLGTTAGTNFMGTTDGTDIVFKTNGAEVFRAKNGNGLVIAPLVAATSTSIDIGALSGGSVNKAINIGTISGGGTAAAFTTGAISAIGATAYQLNLGDITGANATSHAGINMGNISGATVNAYGINTGTLTGGTSFNWGINVGGINSTGATSSYGLNIGVLSGTGTNTFGMNITALTASGTNSFGINLSGVSGVNTTNTGIRINTISGGTTNNFGLRVTGTAAAATNYGIYVDALAQNYFAGQVGIGTTAPTAGRALDVRGTMIGALPVVAIAHFGDDIINGDDDFFAIMVASVPSTNEVWVRVTNSSTINDNVLDNTAQWSAWTNFGQPSGAGGPPYIMSVSVSALQTAPDADDSHALISVRMSDGTVYVRTASDRATAAGDMDDTAFWDAWANFGSPGM